MADLLINVLSNCGLLKFINSVRLAQDLGCEVEHNGYINVPGVRFFQQQRAQKVPEVLKATLNRNEGSGADIGDNQIPNAIDLDLPKL